MKPMRILMLHNKYRAPGGEDHSVAAEVGLLRDAGHDVRLLEANNNDLRGGLSILTAAGSAVWSRKWHDLVSNELRRHRSDILHVQNFFPQISPSVYYAASDRGIPVVQAVRNYRLVCLSANLFRNGMPCAACVPKYGKLNGVLHRCYRGSLGGSAAVATMLAAHRFGGTWSNKVGAYVAVSDYVRQKLIEGGYPAERIFVKPNFVPLRPIPEIRTRKHILFVGRNSPEKGVESLVEAYRLSGIRVPLRLVGDGPKESTVVVPGIEWLGRQPTESVYRLMEEAICVVMPGVWPEPFGRVAIEAFSCGTPVVTSDIGGTRDIVTDEVNGLHFRAGDVTNLADALKRLAADSGLVERYGSAGRSTVERLYSAEANLGQLTRLYQVAMTR